MDQSETAREILARLIFFMTISIELTLSVRYRDHLTEFIREGEPEYQRTKWYRGAVPFHFAKGVFWR